MREQWIPAANLAGDRSAGIADQQNSAVAYEIAEWATARVNIDYHIAFDGNFYSVPYTLVQQNVEVRATAHVVEILAFALHGFLEARGNPSVSLGSAREALETAEVIIASPCSGHGFKFASVIK